MILEAPGLIASLRQSRGATISVGTSDPMSVPTRVVFCITELDAGGAERALTQLVTNLNRQEWESHVICLGPRGHFADLLESAAIPVVCLNARGVISLPRVLYQLTAELRRLRPALVQTFLFHANILGRIAARRAGIPHVVSGLRVAEHRSCWYGRIDRWTNFLVTTNVCVSQGVADFSASVTGLPVKKLVVIPNAVDLDLFAGATPADLSEFDLPAGSRVFITIGRLEHQKGIDLLLDAIAMIAPHSPGHRADVGKIAEAVHFLIVGDGPDSGRLHTLARQLQISDRVHFVGRRGDVPNLLAASQALILPSRWEGMPNVVLEAMAAGKSVIATQVEGVQELVRDGVTGVIVPRENPVELARAILKLTIDHQFLMASGSSAQRVVVDGFTVPTVVQSYSNLYRHLLGSAR